MKKAGVTVYVVGIGGVAGISIKGERLLRRLAVESGGRFFFPSRDEQLPEVHDVLTGDVQNRYLITYTPTEPDDRRYVADDHRQDRRSRTPCDARRLLRVQAGADPAAQWNSPPRSPAGGT